MNRSNKPMNTYKVNADFHVNVSVYVEAESEEDAKQQARIAILNKDCEFEDPIDDPTINWVEIQDDDDI
jgi:hypothetical protein